ncbi:PhaM family polyhydroxyalkanoate granule multifunctional regulatory protein [Burkholderia ubonensis]|uniref:PhaM family polyhydroxyalkanoate granule multifunctional regulatory protein n=1 Tax=Burkholderia ubonensis TaxID=101571 RepID=UPI0007537196|nr:PhaM family polyhydroxyalkanoate granule multifunctional regulatory protein [Burkholderia ubonensis]KVP44749.1 alginate biosynthesis protein AlgP [Burkholderia ubonensis]KVQ13272.1 alginate biosynthesis protein AlgP [Burkholderia ubonensis]KVR44059.1 alginate biosynthesis protein AlgP [Burkholderia ubonensis]KWB77824.1 alginate biosynthesis protein AlgP [Burkholderia ubonensis]KWC10638.1 alginate biosynthesis protein AlgP [Burkholderia ubonensis]
MTIDTSGSNPFSGFAGFQPADMLERMWEMIRMTPFGGMGAFPGATHGLPPSLSGMSDMMAPLASVEELDKRITDLRAVEQWLKLNLGMLQSAIQAMEVQRATLATLRAFGAFAQTSMSAAEDAAVAAAKAAATPLGDTQQAAPPEGAQADAPPEGESAAQNAAFDPAGWWNLLQAQFNQLASLAMTQPGAQAAAPDAPAAPAASAAARPDPADPPPAAPRKPAAKRAKPAGSSGSSGSAAARAAAASTPASRPPKRST